MLGNDSVDEEAAEAVSVTLVVTRSSVAWGSGRPGAVGALDPGAVRACGVGMTVAILPGTESRIDALNPLGGFVCSVQTLHILQRNLRIWDLARACFPTIKSRCSAFLLLCVHCLSR